MKILIINNLYSPYAVGGAEISTQLLAEGLLEVGVEPVVLSLAPTPGADIVNGIKVYYLPLKNIYFPFNGKPNFVIKLLWHLLDSYNPMMMREVGKIINIEKADIVHTNVLAGFSVSIWKEVKRRGIRLIHTLRDYYLLCPKGVMFNNGVNCLSQCFKCRILSSPKKKLSSLVDQVVGISSFVLERHCRAGYFSNAAKRVIYNPVPPIKPTSKFHSDSRVRFGYIGRLHQTKGVEELLVAFKKAPLEKVSLKLAGTGDLSYVSFLRENYGASNIVFLGFVPADELYNQIDVLIVPSQWHEPLGRVVLEAHSHGIPVIAANRGGIPEIVEKGRTGYLYDPGDSDNLINIMGKFLLEPGHLQKMKKNCEVEAKKYSSDNISRQYFNLYNSLLS